MTSPIRTVALTALALTGLVAAWTWSAEGGRFALGVVATGLTMLGSLGIGALVTKRAAASGRPGAALVPFLLKMPMLLGAGWLLLTNFPPLSVILGGGTLVGAITLHAALGTFLPGSAGNA